MKHLFALYLCALFLIGNSVKAQDENHGHCSKLKNIHAQQLRSNTFTIAEIAETEEYDVHYYFLDLSMTNTSTYLEGSGEIHATAREVMDSALFEFFPSFTIASILVDGIPVNYTRNNSAIRVPVNKTAGQNMVIHVNYSGTPPTAASNPVGGGGMTNASSPTWGNQVTWSLSEPFSAFEWFPVKQSLKDKADSSQVWITVPTHLKAGSNGILQQVTDLGNGTHRFEWKHRHPIDYYLISVAVAQYIIYDVFANPVNSGQVHIQNFIYDNPATLSNFQNDIDETADFLELFSMQYGPYPFANEKYGHCMAPIGGGMEHQTMTTQGSFNRTLTAHELAHQWWGNSVTCSSWSDIWINEGFASYSEYIMLQALYPTQAAPNMNGRHNNVMSQSGGSVWVLDSLNAVRIFSGRLTYDKGAAIIHTLRFLIDDDVVFFNGLRSFLTTYSNSTASGMDFIAVMENASGKDFTAFMEQWYFGEGYPTYGVLWNNEGDSIHVQISHFVAEPTITPTFTNDLLLRFDRATLPDTSIRFTITSNQNQFLLPDLQDVVNITAIDPGNWIINQGSGIVKDVNFFVSVAEQTPQPTIRVFPNPADDFVNIEVGNSPNNVLTVFDLQGKVIMSTPFGTSLRLDTSGFPSGAFLIRVSTENATIGIQKLIKRN
ncbi:MAG: M1 family aminopeptidase [Flavobacteriales bacterium]